MGEVKLVGRNFDLGAQSDIAREQLPRGAAYRMRDYIPQNEAPVRKRGGWAQATKDLNAESGATRMTAVGWAPFPNDPHLITVSEGGKVYLCKTFDGTAGTYVATSGLASGLTHRPFWHKSLMILLQAFGASTADPRKYYDSAGYTVASLGGTPPQARVGASWGEYLLLANTIANPNRIFASGPGTPEVYPANNFFDVPSEIVALAPLRNVIFVWGYSDTWLITGDTPPPGGNWARRNLFGANGCMDPRSVAFWREYAVWANNTGIFKSDGATLTNLTKVGGFRHYWRSIVRDFKFSTGWTAAGGVYADCYWITITNSSGTLITTIVYDLDLNIWYEFKNIPAAMYAERSTGPGTGTALGSEEMFFANRSTPRAGMVSGVLSPESANASDGDGTAVLPELETPFYKLSSSELKRLRRAYFTYDIRTAGASPRLDVGVALSPELTTYTTLAQTLPTTTKQERRAVDVKRRVLGASFKLTQVGASAETKLADVEFESHGLEATR